MVSPHRFRCSSRALIKGKLPPSVSAQTSLEETIKCATQTTGRSPRREGNETDSTFDNLHCFNKQSPHYQPIRRMPVETIPLPEMSSMVGEDPRVTKSLRVAFLPLPLIRQIAGWGIGSIFLDAGAAIQPHHLTDDIVETQITDQFIVLHYWQTACAHIVKSCHGISS